VAVIAGLIGIVLGLAAWAFLAGDPREPARSPATPAVPTPNPAATPSETPSAAGGHTTGPCFATEIGYLFQDRTEYSQSDGYIHVEFYFGGPPERETILPFGVGVGGYSLLEPLNGFAWSYPSSCSFDHVHAQVRRHIDERLREGRPNAGYIDWEETGYFEPIRN
jgi:hypothetical protein